jgi:hypothetical protein
VGFERVDDNYNYSDGVLFRKRAAKGWEYAVVLRSLPRSRSVAVSHRFRWMSVFNLTGFLCAGGQGLRLC